MKIVKCSYLDSFTQTKICKELKFVDGIFKKTQYI